MADYQICRLHTDSYRDATFTVCPGNNKIYDGTLDYVLDISTDDLELLYGVLLSRQRMYKFKSASSTTIVFTFTTDYFTALKNLSSANNLVNDMKTEIKGHLVSQRVDDCLDSKILAANITRLNLLTEEYGDLLVALDEESYLDVIGQLFRRYINFSPEDNLCRDYEFLGGTRKLVIPNIGNYSRIKLPKELTCQELSCLVGKNGRIVNRMNELIYQLDWLCLKIAHKMKDHQKTDFDGGPYWVI
jgi:hypothetical protein